MHCPACSTEVPPATENRFCEECGAALTAPPPEAGECVCGAAVSERDEEGFCLRCGRKLRMALPTDRMEEAPTPEFAAVSDRGLRHDRNEDRFGVLATPHGCALVVCDGVSSSRSSEIASAAVAQGVLAFLAAAFAKGPVANPEATLKQAIAAGSAQLDANLRVDTRRLSGSRKMRKPDENPPSTTVVAALMTRSVATVAWLGDSRAYWIDERKAWPLTRDHSWQNDVVSAGEMSAEAAAKAPNAHAITRWIGADADATDAEVHTQPLEGSGILLLCTDGLWNYAASPQEMADLVRTTDSNPPANALERAQALVRFAIERGGQDNITVALLEIAATTGLVEPTYLRGDGKDQKTNATSIGNF